MNNKFACEKKCIIFEDAYITFESLYYMGDKASEEETIEVKLEDHLGSETCFLSKDIIDPGLPPFSSSCANCLLN